MADTNYTNLGILEETTFGTTPGTALQLLRRTGGNLSPRLATTRSEEIRSDLRAGKPVRTATWFDGDISVEWSYGSFDSVLEGLLMEDFLSGVLVDGTTKKSYTFEDQITDPEISPSQFMVYKGGRIGSASMSFATESIVTGSFSVLGATPSIAQASAGTGSATAATSTGVYNTVDMITAIEEAASGSTPSSLTRLMGVDINITRDLRRKMELGSASPFDIGVGDLTIAGTITQHFENDRLADAFFAFSDRLLNIDLTDDAGNLLELELPKIKLVAMDIQVPGRNQDVLATFNFEAYADTGDAALIRFTKTDA